MLRLSALTAVVMSCHLTAVGVAEAEVLWQFDTGG
jgi:hypothetical protein